MTDDEYHALTTCDHPQTSLVRRIYSNGSTHYTEQCQRCGRGIRSVKKTSISSPSLLPLFDTTLEAEWRARNSRLQNERHEKYERERGRKKAEWRAWYKEYLQTSQWRDKRHRVLERDGELCQACLKRRATEVHHLTYEHVGDEPLFDLVSICHVCHERLHEERTP